MIDNLILGFDNQLKDMKEKNLKETEKLKEDFKAIVEQNFQLEQQIQSHN